MKIKPSQKLVFFSLKRGLSPQKRREKELFLWGMYCAHGGDPKALPGFFDFGTKDGLVCSPTLEEFKEAVMNTSRKPTAHAKK